MRRKGFTLTEMLVVISMSIIILAILIMSINYSFDVTQVYIRHNLKQDAYNQIYTNLATLQNAINVIPAYEHSQLWLQIPAIDDDGVIIMPPKNGKWYYLELQNNVIYKINMAGEKIIISSSDIYVDNITFDFDKEAQSIRITCDMWHIKEDRDLVKPLRANFVLNLLNPTDVFEEEMP
jgi:hypothetical protein